MNLMHVVLIKLQEFPQTLHRTRTVLNVSNEPHLDRIDCLLYAAFRGTLREYQQIIIELNISFTCLFLG